MSLTSKRGKNQVLKYVRIATMKTPATPMA